MTDEPNNDLVTNLVVFLMNRDGINVSAENATQSKRYAAYKREADTITSNIAGEDYLSLDLALVDNDTATIDELITKANENKENHVSEGLDLSFIAGLNAKYNQKVEDNTMSKKDRPNTFVQNEKVIFEGREAKVTIPNGPMNTVGILVDDRVRMVDRSSVKKIKEGILGSTKIDGLFRIQQLAGLVKEDEMYPEVMPDEMVDDGYENEMPIDALPPVEPELPAEQPMIEPDPIVSDVAGDSLSMEYKEAIDCLDRVTALIMDMKLSEFKIFVNRAEDFSQKVKDICNQFLDIK